MKRPAFALLLAALLCISAIYQTQNYGLPGASQVGAFINGSLPTESTVTYASIKATPNLQFDKILSLHSEPETNNIFVTDRFGHVFYYDDNPSVSSHTLFLDISSKIWHENGSIGHVQETGIYNLAFHPEFNQQGSPNKNYFYLFYIAEISGVKKLRISRFTRPTGSATADPTSELLLIDQNLFNNDYHRGGGLVFGNDGFLYISIGDLNDQSKTQQNTDYFCGGVLRIDVDMDPIKSHPIRRTLQSILSNSFSGNYYIPFDNPWQHANGSILEEYYALGCRNPHRMTLDAVTGKIFIGNVGSNANPNIKEEINILERGGNFGWPFREGVTNILPVPAYQGQLVDPIIYYPHTQGNICIIGGYVYRGRLNENLQGKYVFGDYGSNRLWAADVYSGRTPISIEEIGIFQNGSLVTFGEGPTDELLMANAHTAQEIFRLEEQSGFQTSPPNLLSQTGAFSSVAPLTPAAFMIPYDVNTPLWSDGAIKKRWFILPNDGTLDNLNEQILFSASGEWAFPKGAVMVKHFELPLDASNPGLTRKLETRLLIHGLNGEYYPLTYKWYSNGSDAYLEQNSSTQNFTVYDQNGNARTQTWDFPGAAECYSCHTQASGRVLGIKSRQLNGDFTYPGSGITANQLASLNHIGAFNFDIDDTHSNGLLTSTPLTNSSVSLEARSLSYLDANCASCHRSDGVAVSNFDALYQTPFDLTNMINGMVIDDLGIANAKVITPGDTATSILYQRIKTTQACCRMPAIGSKLEDTVATKVIADWIMNMAPNYTPCASQSDFLSDLPIASSTNGDGPVELDMSNGFGGANDGTPISLGGVIYNKGLGVHANSEVIFNLNGNPDEMRAVVGLDDSKNNCTDGSIQFRVFGDGDLIYESPVISRGDDPKEISVAVSGVNQLKLVVDDTGDNNFCDHASWGGARLITRCDVPNPFPVEWLSFEVDQMENDAQLTWATVTETGNRHFNVLRSWDGRDFEVIGSVEGTGARQGISEYSFTDPMVTRFDKKQIYYRLKQVDLDGKFSFSETLLLDIAIPNKLLDVYPSVFQEKLNIDIHQLERKAFNLKVVDARGSIIWQTPVTRQNQRFQVHTTDWASGIYFLIYVNDGKTRMKKLIRQ